MGNRLSLEKGMSDQFLTKLNNKIGSSFNHILELGKTKQGSNYIKIST
jgi:hypothetical protein